MKSSFLFIIIIVISFLSAIQFAISYNFATSGEKVRQLEIRASQLEKENAILISEINKNGSLSRIITEAQKLGFMKTNQVLHFTPEIPVAMGR